MPKYNWALVQTYPEFDDNVLEIEKFLAKQSLDKIIILSPNFDLPKNNFEFSNQTIFIKRKSFLGVFYFIFSKYVFITHGLYFRKFSKNQISINLWHGMPLKKIGVEKGKKGIITTYTLSCSETFEDALSNAFLVPKKSILNIGLPRNFRLLDNATDIEIKKEFCLKGQKMIVWLPTYRVSVEGDIRIDGFDFGNIVNMYNFNMHDFNNFLISIDAVCYIKPHPMSKKFDNLSYSNIYFINDNWLYLKGRSLYDLLSQADILISDISSVIVDFLVLNRPIIFSFQDKNEYINSRGVYSYFDLNNLPGYFCENDFELKEAILKNIENGNIHSSQRISLKTMYHKNSDKKVFEIELKRVMGFN